MASNVALSTHPHYLLYKEERNVWNRWARAAFNEEQAKEYGIEELEQFSDEDIKALAKKIGVEEIVNGTIDFSGCTFHDHMGFSGFIFPPLWTVDGKDIINFSKVEFLNDVTFANAIFAKKVIFKDVKFKQKSIFKKTKFKQVYFHEAEFSSLAYFGEADFIGASHFRKCIFNSESVFDNTIFSSFAGFDGSRFDGLSSFSDANFKEFSSFVNAKFLFGVNFSDAKFKRPPNFNGASMHSDTAFLETKFGTESSHKNDAYKRRQEYDHFSRAWRALKLEMNKTHNRPMELEFFGYEQDARIEVEKGSTLAILLSLYKTCSPVWYEYY